MNDSGRITRISVGERYRHVGVRGLDWLLERVVVHLAHWPGITSVQLFV